MKNLASRYAHQALHPAQLLRSINSGVGNWLQRHAPCNEMDLPTASAKTDQAGTPSSTEADDRNPVEGRTSHGINQRPHNHRRIQRLRMPLLQVVL